MESKRTSIRCSLLLVVMTLICLWGNCSVVSAQQYSVGDRIKFRKFNMEMTGTIDRITGVGSILVIVDQNGDRRIPPRTFVRENEIISMEGDSGGGEAAGEVEYEMRKWTSKGGGHSFEGRFVKLDGESLTLLGANGKEVTITLDKLSPDDAKYAKSVSERDDSANPFKASSGTAGRRSNMGRRGSRNSNSNSSSTKFKISEIDFKRVKSIRVNPKPGKLSWNRKTTMASVEGVLNSWVDVPGISISSNVLVDPGNPKLLFPTNYDLRSKSSSGYLVDLDSMETGPKFTFPYSNAKVVTFDAVSRLAVTATTPFERERPKSVDVWKLGEDGDVEHVVGFLPSTGNGRYSVNSGFFVSSNVIAILADDQVGVFDLNDRTAKFAFSFDRASKAVPMGDGKHVLGIANKYPTIVNVETGEVVGSLDVQVSSMGAFAIDPDGTRAAIADRGMLEVFDLATGQKTNTVEDVGLFPRGNLAFCDKEHLLVGKNLVNLRLKFVVGSIPFGSVQPNGDGTFRVVATSGFRQGKVGITTLPPQATKDLVAGLEPEDLIVMPEGASVSVGRVVAAGKNNFTKQLSENGYKLDNGAEFSFLTTTKKGETKTIEYQGIGGAKDETVKLTSETMTIQLLKGTASVWSRTYTTGSQDAGSFVMVEDGESVQSQVDRNRISASDYYAKVKLPKVFRRLPGGNAPMYRSVDSNGFQSN